MNEPSFLILPDETIVNVRQLSRIERSSFEGYEPTFPDSWTIRVHLLDAQAEAKSYHFASKPQADALYNRLKSCIEDTASRVYLTPGS